VNNIEVLLNLYTDPVGRCWYLLKYLLHY